MSEIEELKKRIGSQKEELDKIKAKIKKDLSESFGEIIKTEIFDKYPEVKTISWTQGTPSWCDGGPCSFWCDASSGEFDTNGYNHYDFEDEEDTDEMPNIQLRAQTDDKYQKIEDTMVAIIGTFESADYLDLFGDSVRVTLTKDGSSTEYHSPEY